MTRGRPAQRNGCRAVAAATDESGDGQTHSEDASHPTPPVARRGCGRDSGGSRRRSELTEVVARGCATAMDWARATGETRAHVFRGSRRGSVRRLEVRVRRFRAKVRAWSGVPHNYTRRPLPLNQSAPSSRYGGNDVSIRCGGRSLLHAGLPTRLRAVPFKSMKRHRSMHVPPSLRPPFPSSATATHRCEAPCPLRPSSVPSSIVWC